ncbi:transcriptional regulator, PaaX family [Roseivivax lentus]|uniref:Transcriptional regulator, PaaX family n=1 Tax=Roseivivax lentus TaxID=633194 RepID=A0A1N7LQ66_9RHOB|nr:PaaX family transcriptional regulator C-terminal domain-containing protein [Roseivivax lentus]SIS75968.1 transcriptional regulator, PaaX family [Roseivivax lentus]
MTDQPRFEPSGRPPAEDAILSSGPPRATAFIVTIYGDAVAPRGGVLSMRSLIEVGAVHGLSESLVRTAVSRLVAAGRLVGERVGRTSFYRLTEAAETEFAAAARVLYDPPAPASGWLLAMTDALPGEGWAQIATGLCVAPDRSDIARPDALTFASEVIAGAAQMPDFAAAHWPLGAVAEAYRDFLDRFAPLAADPAMLGAVPPEAALALRLRLVHAFRAAALADPRLPAPALPGDWPGGPARAAFVTAYLALADAADAEIARRFEDARGPLPQETARTQARLQRLRRESITH